MLNPLSNEQIECLNCWPEGTIGNSTDRLLIQEINNLCKRFGYGRIPHIANALEEIWRNPEEGVKNWQEVRDERMRLLEEGRQWLKDTEGARDDRQNVR